MSLCVSCFLFFQRWLSRDCQYRVKWIGSVQSQSASRTPERYQKLSDKTLNRRAFTATPLYSPFASTVPHRSRLCIYPSSSCGYRIPGSSPCRNHDYAFATLTLVVYSPIYPRTHMFRLRKPVTRLLRKRLTNASNRIL